jgi:hypothetical protein
MATKKTSKKPTPKKSPEKKKTKAKPAAKTAKTSPAKKTAKKSPAKKTAKKPAAKKTAAKKTAKKTVAKKTAAKKAPAKKAPAKKTTAKKTTATKKAPAKKKASAKPAATKKTTATKNAASAPTASAAAASQDYVLPVRRPLDVASLSASYRDGGDAMAHPVTSEQMDEVRTDGLRGDDGVIRHVDDDSDVAPCRLVDHGEGRYSLCLDDYRMPSVALFDERGLQGGGYTWEAIADSLMRLRRPELVSGVSYDTESSMFVAMGTRPTMLALAHLLQEALNDEALLRAAVDAADPDRLE